MLKAKVIIIEDEFFAAEHLKSLVSDQEFWVVGTYHSGEDFLKETDWEFDMAILDIFLSGSLTGIDLAQHMNRHKKPFVFITANKDSKTIKDVARLKPAGYISKPFDTHDVIASLEIMLHQLPEKFKINTKSGARLINPREILFVKSDGVYSEIHLENESFIQRKTLKDVASELPDTFVRVHRSYLVNKYNIESQNSKSLRVGSHSIPISRSFKDLDELQ